MSQRNNNLLPIPHKIMIVVVTTVVVLLAVKIATRGDWAAGVVKIDGYPHAVAICEGGGNAAMVPIKKNWPGKQVLGYMWKDEGIFYLVDATHMGDIELRQLETKAQAHCSTLWY